MSLPACLYGSINRTLYVIDLLRMSDLYTVQGFTYRYIDLLKKIYIYGDLYIGTEMDTRCTDQYMGDWNLDIGIGIHK